MNEGGFPVVLAVHACSAANEFPASISLEEKQVDNHRHESEDDIRVWIGNRDDHSSYGGAHDAGG